MSFLSPKFNKTNNFIPSHNFPFKESIRTLLYEAVEILSIINISFHFKSVLKTMFSETLVNILQKKNEIRNLDCDDTSENITF